MTHKRFYLLVLYLILVYGKRHKPPINDPKDCMQTEKGETYSGHRQNVVKRGVTYKCYDWSLANWNFLRLVNFNDYKVNRTLESYQKVIQNWIKYKSYNLGNQCRNPGQIWRRPSCITDQIKDGKLEPCDVPLCDPNWNRQNNKFCSINLSGDGYVPNKCPTYVKHFPAKNVSCSCIKSQKKSHLGLYYESKMSQGQNVKIPCIVPDCDGDAHSFVVSGGRDVYTWWRVPQFSQYLHLNVRGYSSSINANLLVQLRQTPDMADAGINLQISQKHFHEGHKATLVVLPSVGHIPAITNYLSVLGEYQDLPGIGIQKKFWPRVFDSDHWSKLQIVTAHGKVAVADSSQIEGKPHLILPMNGSSGAPKWIRFQSDDMVEVSFGQQAAVGCPILLTLPTWKEINLQQKFTNGFGQIKSATKAGHIRKHNLFKNIKYRSQKMKYKNEGQFFKMSGEYPELTKDFYVKGQLTGDAEVIISKYPLHREGFAIKLDNSLQVCIIMKQTCIALDEWKKNKQQIKLDVQHLNEQLISDLLWTRFVVRISANIISLYRGNRDSKHKENGKLQILMQLNVTSLAVLPLRYISFRGKLHQWAIDCIPEDLQDDQSSQNCSPKRPKGISMGIGYQGEQFFGLNSRSKQELCRSWSYEKQLTYPNMLSYFPTEQKKSYRFQNYNFANAVIPGHNYCRNIFRRYSSTPTCIGYISGENLRCQTTCTSDRMYRTTLLGSESKSLLRISRTGQTCLKNTRGESFSQEIYGNIFTGITCAIEKSNATKSYIFEPCTAPISKHSHKRNEKQLEFDITGESIEYINLLPIRDGITFGILPAKLSDFAGLHLIFYNLQLENVLKVVFGNSNYLISYRMSHLGKLISKEIPFTRELLSENQMYHFHLKLSNQLWILSEIQDDDILGINELFSIRAGSFPELQQVVYMAFGSTSKQDSSSLSKWMRIDYETHQCPLIMLVKSQHSHNRKLPFGDHQYVILHSLKVSESFFKIVFFEQAVISIPRTQQKKIIIFLNKGKLSLNKLKFESKKPIISVSFGIKKFTPNLWLKLCYALCPYLNVSKLKKRQLKQNNQFSLISPNISGQNIHSDFSSHNANIEEDFPYARLPQSESYLNISKINIPTESDLKQIHFFFEYMNGTISPQPIIQHSQENMSESYEWQTIQEYESLQRLLRSRQLSLATLPQNCRPPLWIGQWIFQVSVKSKGISETMPFVIVKPFKKSQSSILYANFWSIVTPKKKQEVVIQSGNCQMPRFDKGDQLNENGRWGEKQTWCSQNCGTGFGYHRWHCKNVSIHGDLCYVKGSKEPRSILTTKRLCNRYQCGFLSKKYESDLNVTTANVSQINFEEGGNVTISCMSTALIQIHKDKRFRKLLKLFWFKGDQLYKHSSGFSGIGELKFKPSFASDSGLYQCLISLDMEREMKQESRATNLRLTDRVIYLAAVKPVIFTSKKATHRISMSRPFVFTVEAEAYCTPLGYQCRTVLLHKIRSVYRVIYDYETYVHNFTLIDLLDSQLGEYKICIERYALHDDKQMEKSLNKDGISLMCMKYYHIKESVWMKHFDKLLLYINAYAAYDFLMKHPILSVLLLLVSSMFWLLMVLGLKWLEERDLIAGDEAASQRARERVLNMGLDYPLTPYEEQLLVQQQNKERGTAAMAKFWKCIRFFTKKWEENPSEAVDGALQGLQLLEHQDLSTSDLFISDIMTAISTDSERSRNSRDENGKSSFVYNRSDN